MPSLAGDWECTYCSWTNVASVRRCDDCDAPAPAPSPVALTQLPPNPAKAEEAPPSSPPPPAPPPAEESPPKSGAPSSSSPQLSPPPEQEPSYVLDPRYSRTDFAWSARLAEENARVFGAAPLRPEQEQAVNAALDKRDVLVVLPTGFGKSRCYQVPALLEDGLTVLVVPLLSLMTDQWHALNAAGISAQYMNSNQTGAETTQVVRAAPHPPPPPRPHRTVPPPPHAPMPPPAALGPARRRSQILRSLNDPRSTTKVLLVTPERLTASLHLQNAMHRMHADGMRRRLTLTLTLTLTPTPTLTLTLTPTPTRHAAPFRHRRGALVRPPLFRSHGGATRPPTHPPTHSPTRPPARSPCTCTRTCPCAIRVAAASSLGGATSALTTCAWASCVPSNPMTLTLTTDPNPNPNPDPTPNPNQASCVTVTRACRGCCSPRRYPRSCAYNSSARRTSTLAPDLTLAPSPNPSPKTPALTRTLS